VIVNDGKLVLADFQGADLATTHWRLFTTNVAIVNTTVKADLTEAAWGGYAAVSAGAWGAAVLVSNKAVKVPTTNPSFTNTSGANQTFWGWYLTDDVSGKLIAAVNIGATVISNGAVFPLAAAISDDQA
jgi:hypothetical protein